MKIGSTDLNGSGPSNFKKTTFLDVEANKANVYRVFPPLFSLADKGAVTYYYKTHSIWLTSKTGKQYPVTFKCLLRKKDKVVTQDCPHCTLAEKYQAMYDQGQELLKGMPEGESKEAQKKQLGEFLRNKVWNTQSDGKNYLNVIDVNGKIGVLRVSYKQYEAFKARVADLGTQYKTDPTGMTGIFLNFSKFSPYKGSKDVTFAVDAFMEQTIGANGMPSMNFKYHQLTDDVIAKMEKECEDLTLLYKDIAYADAQELASKYEDKEALKAACDRIFAAPAASTTPDVLAQVAASAAVGAAVGSPVAAPVAPVTMADIPFAPVAPVAAAPAFVPQAPIPAPAPVAAAPVAPAFVPQAPAPVAAPAAGGIFGSAQVPQGGLSNVSEDEFAKLFG